MGKETVDALTLLIRPKTEEIVEVEKMSQEGRVVLPINCKGRKVLVNIRLSWTERLLMALLD